MSVSNRGPATVYDNDDWRRESLPDAWTIYSINKTIIYGIMRGS